MFQNYFLTICSVALFLYNFFPVYTDIPNSENEFPLQVGDVNISLTKLYPPHFGKLVFFVIDALRFDFITPLLMPLTYSLVKDKGCISKVLVESPTVTMPRIKALASGNVPQFVDVIRNLASSEIVEDSWLHSAKHMFIRSEGTSSFYVWDFTEVDDNITKNVNIELNRKDWNIMILHYLGLDHMGHVYGPYSSRIPLKLEEMDKIIHKIFKNTLDDNTLLVVTGDHGMKDSGGHGGSTVSEVTTPLVSLGLKCQDSSFLQTDVAANLAVLMGIPIPSSSMGQIQESLLSNMLSIEQYLFAMYYNTKSLLQKRNLCTGEFKLASEHHTTFLKQNKKLHVELANKFYKTCSEKIIDNLRKDMHRQNFLALLVAVLILLNNIPLMLNIFFDIKKRHNTQYCLLYSIGLLNFFINFTILSYISLSVLIIMCIFNFIHFANYFTMCSLTVREILIFGSCIVHPITFFSSSFIEEEHQMWYFLGSTWLIILISDISGSRKLLSKVKLVKLMVILLALRGAREINANIDTEYSDKLINIEDWVYSTLLIFTLFTVWYSLCDIYKPPKLKLLNILILFLIFTLKSFNFYQIQCGKIVWFLIIIQIFMSRKISLDSCILIGTLLVQPHNTILISLAIYVAREFYDYEQCENSTLILYLFENFYFFLQGHRNTLASLDISVGYIGLSEYNPLFVIPQVVSHLYIFHILFHMYALESSHFSGTFGKKMWNILFLLRSYTMLFVCIVLISFSNHLFIWSVFSPKFFIESAHSMFLFFEGTVWHLYYFLKKH
ncbi:GPI ethanolamine phosphate transferase 2 isoform X2 [Cylas formicarius]|uniref:GPI ethanolamine phosphate transferase 2 isoform X2 n=1 Tax=Cylas formicarius TaxID=197179 RepID=UPI0029585ACB|nr:GPI ethanolamine phosphate transferase 2 isoform X2 [Cylas formicarius]